MKLPMKLLRTAGLCLTAMFAVSMFASATASAAKPVFEHCVEGSTTTKYETNQCAKALSTGTFGWAEVAGTDAVRTHGSLLLIDTKTTLGVAEVECWGESIGMIGPGKVGRVTEVKVETKNCHNRQNCTTIVSVAAVHLPWSTEIFQTENKPEEKLVNGNGAEPGWAVTCKVIVNFTDECLQVAGKEETLTLQNESTAGVLLVRATFNNGPRKAHCTQSGAETGEVIGKQALLLKSGAGLRVT